MQVGDVLESHWFRSPFFYKRDGIRATCRHPLYESAWEFPASVCETLPAITITGYCNISLQTLCTLLESSNCPSLSVNVGIIFPVIVLPVLALSSETRGLRCNGHKI